MLTLFGPDGRPLPNVRPFLDAIRNQPDEDAPRLALADFLQKRGDADRGDEGHAALIRRQCELDGDGSSTDVREIFEPDDEERRLLKENDRLTSWPGQPGVYYDRFVRGLPTAIQVADPDPLHQAGARPALALGTVDTLIVERATPARALAWRLPEFPVSRLQLGVEPGELPTLFADADVSRVSGWWLDGRLGRHDLVPLRDAARRGPQVVKELGLRVAWSGAQRHATGVEDVIELARGMRAGLLSLFCVQEGGRVIRGLTAPPHTDGHGLRWLAADFARLGDGELRALARWPGARYLEYLSVASMRGEGPGDDGIEALVSSPYLSAPRGLRLFGWEVTDRGAATLAGAPAGWDLRYLGLRQTRVTAKGVAALRDRFPKCRIDWLDED